MKMNKKLVLIILPTVLCLSAASAIWIKMERKPASPDFSARTPKQITEYLNSVEFKNLDAQTRREYGRLAFRQIMDSRVDEYFKLPQENRAAYLDKLIDEMQTRRQNFRRDPNDPNRPQRPRQQQARSPENMRKRMESIPPETRAKRDAFREAMRQRRQQRG